MQSCKEAVQEFVSQLCQHNGMALFEAHEAYQTLLAHFESEDALEEALVLAHPQCESFIEQLYINLPNTASGDLFDRANGERWIPFFPAR